jgi:hypothetical protein
MSATLGKARQIGVPRTKFFNYGTESTRVRPTEGSVLGLPPWPFKEIE